VRTVLVDAGTKRVAMLRPGNFVQTLIPGHWVEVVEVDRSRDPLVGVLVRDCWAPYPVPYLVPADVEVEVAVEVMD